MPRRAKRLLDDTIVPTKKKTGAASDKLYLAVFLVSQFSKPGVREKYETTIEAPNRIAAVKMARMMCHNPMIFPAGVVARIPDDNVSEIQAEKKQRQYEAVFEVYRKGDTSSRPHLVHIRIMADNRMLAHAKAEQMCSGNLGGKAFDSDLVRCPLKNIRVFKR